MAWIKELCYGRLDLAPLAPTDSWVTGHHACISHMYLGQRRRTRLTATSSSVWTKEIAADLPPLKGINDGKVTALTAVQKIESGSVRNHHGQRQERQLHQRGWKPHGLDQ